MTCQANSRNKINYQMTHLSDVEITEAWTFNSNRFMHRSKTTKTDTSTKK